MLWRIRTTLPDRPGALAVLAQNCGEAGVNILGLQIFPGVDAVTDELVLRVPDGWGMAEIAALVERSGGGETTGTACTEAALVDQPTRYVQAARAILGQPASFPEVVARLFDAEADPVPGADDVMEMTVGRVQVQVRRAEPFTATEHVRGAALADLVSDVLARSRTGEAGLTPAPSRRLGAGIRPDYGVRGDAVLAVVEGTTVGVAELKGPVEAPPAATGAVGADAAEVGVQAVALHVDPAWQRRGIGARLLVDVARLAAGRGIDAILLTTRPDNQAVLPTVRAAGLRARIRMASGRLTVQVPVGELQPLPA